MTQTPDQIRGSIERAGKTLALFPKGFGRPQGHRSCWPATMREMIIIVNTDGPDMGIEVILPDPEVIRRHASTREATELDTVMDWIRDYALYCLEKNIRVALVNTMWLAMLHSPANGRRLISWRKIGKKLDVSHTTAIRWYREGIDRISHMQNEKSTGHEKKMFQLFRN